MHNSRRPLDCLFALCDSVILTFWSNINWWVRTCNGLFLCQVGNFGFSYFSLIMRKNRITDATKRFTSTTVVGVGMSKCGSNNILICSHECDDYTFFKLDGNVAPTKYYIWRSLMMARLSNRKIDLKRWYRTVIAIAILSSEVYDTIVTSDATASRSIIQAYGDRIRLRRRRSRRCDRGDTAGY